MELADFERGQTAYAIEHHAYMTVNASGGGSYESLEEYTVQSVGKKYVTALRHGTGRKYRFQKSVWDPSYLIHAEDELIFLFPSRQAVEDYEEIQELRVHVRDMFDMALGSKKFLGLTLTQLRQIWDVIGAAREDAQDTE